MEMRVTLKVEYKSGRYRQLAWIEKDPQFVIDSEGDKEKRPATIAELEASICRSVGKMMDEGVIRSFKDLDTEKAVVVRFGDVTETEIIIEEVNFDAL